VAVYAQMTPSEPSPNSNAPAMRPNRRIGWSRFLIATFGTVCSIPWTTPMESLSTTANGMPSAATRSTGVTSGARNTVVAIGPANTPTTAATATETGTATRSAEAITPFRRAGSSNRGRYRPTPLFSPRRRIAEENESTAMPSVASPYATRPRRRAISIFARNEMPSSTTRPTKTMLPPLKSARTRFFLDASMAGGVRRPGIRPRPSCRFRYRMGPRYST
jgi:hypothetical protein